jgi:hypothetical protein
MSLLIFSIGVSGVIAMQKVTVTSSQHAKDLAIATQVAQAWVDQLHADAIAWNHPSVFKTNDDLDDTAWLKAVSKTAKDWVLPAYVSERSFGPAFDVQGKPIADGSDAKFCTHIRLSWLYQPSAPGATLTGNGLIRTEVRVFWLRDGKARLNGKSICDPGQTPAAAIGSDLSRFHFVYNVSAVRENTAQ